jgi:hypothetical protein
VIITDGGRMPEEMEKLAAGLSDKEAAGFDEIKDAIAGLTEAELLRLERYAFWRMRGARGFTDHNDLLHQALTATLQGTRRWYKNKVDLVGHLLGAMQSIASNWNKRPAEDEIDKLTEVLPVSAGQEEQLLAREELANIKKKFINDTTITLIICELEEGLKLKEIREKYGMPANVYEAAIKRMRRKLDQLYQGR